MSHATAPPPDDVTLLETLLGRTARRRPASATRALLTAHGGLAGLAATEASRPQVLAPLGRAGAARLGAALEIARRVAAGPDRRPAVRDPEDVVREVRDIAAAPREHLVGLYLDAHARLIARETLAVGSLNVARAAPRDVLEPALRLLAAGFVIAHNHPSGVAEPSEDDVLFTRSVGRAGMLLGIPLWDHVVLARGGHVSLRARGVSWDGREGP